LLIFLGSSIYIVDTGLDTEHTQFSGDDRIVENIFDAYSSHLVADNDVVGHGTHCAGIAGGKDVGVAPRANIFGLKVLSDEGSGYTSDILAALEFVAERESEGRGVVSMSLGGGCEGNCEEDPLIVAIKQLKDIYNIPVVVAGGNEACSSCRESPSASSDAIVVASSTSTDLFSSFSNYDSCIDIIAPGSTILSACASHNCGDTSSFIEMSGTSMATPAVAGTVAFSSIGMQV